MGPEGTQTHHGHQWLHLWLPEDLPLQASSTGKPDPACSFLPPLSGCHLLEDCTFCLDSDPLAGSHCPLSSGGLWTFEVLELG